MNLIKYIIVKTNNCDKITLVIVLNVDLQMLTLFSFFFFFLLVLAILFIYIKYIFLSFGVWDPKLGVSHRHRVTSLEILLSLCDALNNLVPFLRFQNWEKHPWKRVTFSNIIGWSLYLDLKSLLKYSCCHTCSCYHLFTEQNWRIQLYDRYLK